jgi:hypothetical protein
VIDKPFGMEQLDLGVRSQLQTARPLTGLTENAPDNADTLSLHWERALSHFTSATAMSAKARILVTRIEPSLPHTDRLVCG